MVPTSEKKTNSERVKTHLELLKALCHCKKNIRNSIIQKGSRSFINSICECADNLLQNNIDISQEDFDKLRKNKGVFRKLVKKKSDIGSKKKLIIQNGGFLQFLIPAAVTLITDLISNAIKE